MNRSFAVCLGIALLFGRAAQAESLSPLKLPPPRTDAGQPFMRVLQDRQTTREFTTNSLPLQALSDLLWAAFGVNRPKIDHRTAPSAMNSQEIDLYVATAEGLFVYEAKPHQLQPVLARDVRAQTGGQPFVKIAPVSLLFVADFARMTKAKPEQKEPYAWVDTGFISQNIYLFCASAGLGCVVHDLDRGPLNKAMNLRPDQKIILAQAVGFPKK